MKRTIVALLTVAMLVATMLPAPSVSAASVKEELEGYTLEPHEKWTTGDIKGWAEAECIPFRYTVENNGDDSLSLNLPLRFDHKTDGTIGIVDFENFSIPGGNVTGPTLDDSGLYYWNVTVPPNTTYVLEWCARLSNEAGLWPGSSMQVHANGKTVPIQVSGLKMPDLYATKTAVVTCDVISYTINYGNDGDAAQTGVVLVDDYDETKVTVTDDGGGTDNGNTITWDIGCMAAGSAHSKTYTVSIKEGTANGAAIINSGNITGDLAEDDYANNAYSVTSYAKVSPIVSITPDPAEVCPNVDLQLNGNPSGGSGTYTSHSWTGTGAIFLSDTNIENPVFNSPTLGTYSLTYAVTDANGCTRSDEVVVTVKRCAPDFTADIYNYKAVNMTVAQPGDTLSFTIYYQNTGNMDATGVVITDVVDANLENVTPQDGGTYNATSRTITWNIGAVAVNASGTVHFTADIVSPLDDGTIIENTGTIDSDQTDPEDTNTTETTVGSVTPPVTPAGGGGGGSTTKYLTVDWEGNNTTKPLYSNDKLAVDLLGPSPDGSHSLFLERGTHAPVVDETTYYLIVVREPDEIPPLPEGLTAIVVFNITPTDAVFDKDIFLTLGLNETQLPENALNVTMNYYDDIDGVWVPLEYEAGGPNGVAELTLSAPINHFSIYGVLADLAPTPVQPAHFVPSGLSITPGVEKIWKSITFVTRTGASVTITANIANDGGQEGTYDVVLKLNGQTVDTKTVTIAAGQSKQVSFTKSGLDYGQYDVEVAGLTGEFTASRTIAWWLIILIIVAVGLIIWGIIWGRRRRRQAQQEA